MWTSTKHFSFLKLSFILTLMLYGILLMSVARLTEFYNQFNTPKTLAQMSFIRISDAAMAENMSPRVACLILTCDKYLLSRAVHVNNTWAQRCDHTAFLSAVPKPELMVPDLGKEVDDKYRNLWKKTRNGFLYAYGQFGNDTDWYIKADDDTYVIMENVKSFLSNFSPDDPIMFGMKLTNFSLKPERLPQGESHVSGGAGYIVSREAAKRMYESFEQDANNSQCRQIHPAEDAQMSRCLLNLGAKIIDVNKNNWTKKSDIRMHYSRPVHALLSYRCCSGTMMSFHYMRPYDMYMAEFFIYHVSLSGAEPPAVTDSNEKLRLRMAMKPYKHMLLKNTILELPIKGETGQRNSPGNLRS